MAKLKKCRTCGKQVSSSAEACPHCGAKLPNLVDAAAAAGASVICAGVGAVIATLGGFFVAWMGGGGGFSGIVLTVAFAVLGARERRSRGAPLAELILVVLFASCLAFLAALVGGQPWLPLAVWSVLVLSITGVLLAVSAVLPGGAWAAGNADRDS